MDFLFPGFCCQNKLQFFDEEDLDKLEEKPPVLTIMGHVDHGKVSGIALPLGFGNFLSFLFFFFLFGWGGVF